MNNSKLISVIIPVFNGEKYVASCLDNMMNQTYKNLEIIVVDDGSVDDSAKIAHKYPVKLISHDKNRGLSAARNTGIDAASGDYIHFMDVDDAINNDYYKNMIDAIVSENADIACGGMVNEKYKYKTQRFKTKKVYSSTEAKMKATYVGKWGYVWRYLFKLDFLRTQNLRFEEGRFIEDLIFSIQAVFYSNKLVVVPGTEYYYYHRENSILTNKDKTHREKRRADKKHAKSEVLRFANSKNIKLPGVNSGRMSYLVRKLYLSVFSKKDLSNFK